MNVKLNLKQKVLAILAGLFVGFVNGFLGAGGGMLVVPLLRIIYKHNPKTAHATAVLIILPICIVSSIVYLLKGSLNFNVLWPVTIGTFAGGVAGTFLLSKFKNNVLTILFSLVMIFAGCFLIVSNCLKI